MTVIDTDRVRSILKHWHFPKNGIEAIPAVCGKEKKREGLLTAQAEEEN